MYSTERPRLHSVLCPVDILESRRSGLADLGGLRATHLEAPRASQQAGLLGRFLRAGAGLRSSSGLPAARDEIDQLPW